MTHPFWPDLPTGPATRPQVFSHPRHPTTVLARSPDRARHPTAGLHPCAHLVHLAFSPDGKTLASAGDDGVRLWNVATRERVGFLDDAKAAFTSLCFSGDGKTLVAGDHSGRLHFWRTAIQ